MEDHHKRNDPTVVSPLPDLYREWKRHFLLKSSSTKSIETRGSCCDSGDGKDDSIFGIAASSDSGGGGGGGGGAGGGRVGNGNGSGGQISMRVVFSVIFEAIINWGFSGRNSR
ncbi:hypothetical protein ACH5RR_033883 [Cinchona calisaya]|uniref:Glycine-rich protein n=1 Tax=Cinchona calisaya TaxID=153742 RepID=A0ABD2Y998_9GENT